MSAAKQSMFDRAIAARREQRGDERAAGLPAGALGVEAMADLDVDEELTDGEIVRAVTDAFGLTNLAAISRMELIDFGAARALAEAN